MKRLTVLVSVLLLLAGVLLAPPAVAAPVPPPTAGVSSYTGDLTPDQLAELLATGIDRQEVVTSSGAAQGSVQVEVVLPDATADALIARGLPLEEKRPASAGRFAAGQTVFRSYSEPGGIKDEMYQVARDNPSLAKLVVIGKTVQGKDIVAVKVTKDARKVRDGGRPAVLYISAQHAREWITPEMTRRLLHHYLDSYRTDKDVRRVVDTTELWFVPVANPDGYDFTFTDPDNRLWRKNLHDNDGDGQITSVDGVDLNRNYPGHWGYDNEGSSPAITSDVYRGTAATSEPETKALDGLMRRVGFKFLVNYHSASELLLYGTSFQVATPTPDDLIYEAMVGDDADPAVPGYDPDLSAELYTTNGDTDDWAHNRYGTLSFTPEMTTCETASDIDPNDAFEADACESVFNFPDSEPLIEQEFEKNVPFALAVAQSAQDPSHPKSLMDRTVPDFAVDTFKVSYGDPQTVAVTARRDLGSLTLRYRINGGRERTAAVREWRGGERFGDAGDTYFAEYRGTIRGTKAQDRVEVWFTADKRQGSHGSKRVQSEHFSYRVAHVGGSVLVLANEDYEGVNPEAAPNPTGTPKYAQQYVAALKSAGVSSAVWDVSRQGVPHDLGVLSHFDAVVWYLGDNRLTQDPEDEFTDTFAFGPLPDLSVAERQQYLTMSVRDYLNGGGKLAFTGETAGYYGLLGSALGGIYYGQDGAPDQDCVVTSDFLSDCLLLADDFTQYYMGAWSRGPRPGPTTVEGKADPLTGVSAGLTATPTNPLDENGTFLPTSDVLPPADFPLFAGQVSSIYRGGPPGVAEPLQGDWFAAAQHADDSYMRLTRTVDLTAIAAGDTPTLRAGLSVDTEQGYDNVIVEAHTVGAEDWTTLPDVDGTTSSTPPTQCEDAFLLDEHPFLSHYLTLGNPCLSTGTTGAWNALTGTAGAWQRLSFDLSAFAGKQVELSISYVTDPSTGGSGLYVDQAEILVGGAVIASEGFETGLGAWSVPGQPDGSPANSGDFQRQQTKVGPSITTKDTVLLGFGIEQVADPAQRASLLGSVVDYLTGTS